MSYAPGPPTVVLTGAIADSRHRASRRALWTRSRTSPKKAVAVGHGAINAAAFLLAFIFVWLVFDNLALGLLAGLIIGGGSEVAQRATYKKPD
jgi:hypothetical protein